MGRQERATRTPPRGILKSSPTHQPRASSSSDQARHVTMTSGSGLDGDMVGQAARTIIPSRRYTCSEGDLGKSGKSARARPHWFQLLLSTFSIKKARSTGSAASSAQGPVLQRSATPLPYHERISTSQISLPYALGARNRASSDLGELPRPPSRARTGHRRVRSVSPKYLGIATDASRRLGNFDFERNGLSDRAA